MNSTFHEVHVAPASAALLESLALHDYSFTVTEEVQAAFDRPIDACLQAVEPYEKAYFNQPQQFSAYLDSLDGALFVAHFAEQAAGYLAISRHWNGLALVEDIAVERNQRHCGCGQALMAAGIRWAHEQGLAGLMLETQSNNVAACRFYERQGFELGGIDRCLYRGLHSRRAETALFWYLWF
ncbi:GNAT family N-acetyltransferase [Paramixta manurensis]|uniref:GNAT family N-acetyltransferase n=1 Tax=Paramixta manurensis TaxID=2740817 RepID=A0A6M8U624_9GAMM|nr:GNAT family N-acetyltransferase [Erwiniaceae bacterium PD-1]